MEIYYASPSASGGSAMPRWQIAREMKAIQSPMWAKKEKGRKAIRVTGHAVEAGAALVRGGVNSNKAAITAINFYHGGWRHCDGATELNQGRVARRLAGALSRRSGWVALAGQRDARQLE